MHFLLQAASNTTADFLLKNQFTTRSLPPQQYPPPLPTLAPTTLMASAPHYDRRAAAEEIGDRHDKVGETEGLLGHVDVDLPKIYDTHAGSVSSANFLLTV